MKKVQPEPTKTAYEYRQFEQFAKRLLSVPREEINEKAAEYKVKKKEKIGRHRLTEKV